MTQNLTNQHLQALEEEHQKTIHKILQNFEDDATELLSQKRGQAERLVQSLKASHDAKIQTLQREQDQKIRQLKRTHLEREQKAKEAQLEDLVKAKIAELKSDRQLYQAVLKSMADEAMSKTGHDVAFYAAQAEAQILKELFPNAAINIWNAPNWGGFIIKNKDGIAVDDTFKSRWDKLRK